MPDRRTLVRALRFGVSGVLATGLHMALAATLIGGCSLPPVPANGVAFSGAVACSYLLNTVWSFSARPRRDNLLRFVGVSLLGLALTLLISSAAQRLGLSYWAGLAGIVLVVPPVTFLLHRRWTYR